MEQKDFFQHIQSHFDDVLPFVIYKKPKETAITAILQNDDTLYFVDDYTESGFVFAPFDTKQSQSILIPTEDSTQLSFASLENLDDEEKPLGKPPSIISTIKRKDHMDLVQRGIDEINNTRLKKVVLSRKQELPHSYQSPLEIFKKLASKYPTAFVYCWYHPSIGLWLGATPETLLSVYNRKLHTMSLAGTQKMSDHKIAWGDKEIEEQQYVTDSIVENLQDLVDDLTVSNVQTHKAGALLHLKTDISATLNTTKTELGVIIDALHPTPAVCGLPRNDAKTFIANNEHYNRAYYTGFLGELNIITERKRASSRRNVENLAYTSIKKHTHLFVNLRCMEVDAQGAQLYVGGGITASSNPEAEWEETVNKLQTIGDVLLS